MTNAGRKRPRLRRAARFLGFALLLVCAIRLSLWHVENDIREAAYRHAFGNLYHNRGHWRASFIAVRYGWSCCTSHSVPVLTTPFLLNRFRGCKPPVRPESESCYDEGQQRMADRKTGRTGAVFYTGAIWWVSWDTVRIEVGYYEGMLSASGNVYTLKRKHGRWVVVSDRMLWIS